MNVGYRSTNYWVVSAGASRLLVGIGWPGAMGTMKANLKRSGKLHYGTRLDSNPVA